jgi:hypothetical protein
MTGGSDPQEYQYDEGGGEFPPYKEDYFQRIIDVSFTQPFFQCIIDFYVHIRADPSPPTLPPPLIGVYNDIYWNFVMSCPGTPHTAKMFYWDGNDYVYTDNSNTVKTGKGTITSQWGPGGGWSGGNGDGRPWVGDSAQFGFTFSAEGSDMSPSTISCTLVDAGHAIPPPIANNPELMADVAYVYDPTYIVAVKASIVTSSKPFNQVEGKGMHGAFNLKGGTVSI